MISKRLLCLISLILFLGFIYFSYLVAHERFNTFDFDTTVKLQDHLSRRWDLPFSTLSVLGSVEVTSLIWLSIWIISLVKKYWLTFITLPLFFGGLAIEVYGKLFVEHPSPPYLFYRGVIDFNFPSHFVHTDYSYPSGHLYRTAFLISFLLLYLQFKFSKLHRVWFQGGLVVLLIGMMVSRVYLGEHWSTDVVGGLLLGSSLGVFTATTIPLKRSNGLSVSA